LTTSDIAEFLLEQIGRAKALRLVHTASPDRAEKRLLLREWQASRLAHTHADLLDHPKYGPAAAFFLSDLYGTKDTMRRDAALERIYPIMSRMLSETALHTVGLAVELDALTEELDAELLDVLVQRLGPRDQITESAYADAYRRCDNYALRKHQIDLIRQVGDDLARLVDKPLLYAALRGMRTPARLAGVGDLQEFLERGFTAFRHMEDPHPFLDAVERRETQILERIYARHPRPFDLDEPPVAA